MPVPDTDSFAMTDVVAEIGAGTNLDELFALAVGTFDPIYVGDKTNLLNFRNYTHSLSPDPDVSAFLVATGITDPTIIAALEGLVATLKSTTAWTRALAIYPFVGGTEFTHQFNLKNVNTFLGNFSQPGTVTHNAQGIRGNGVSGFMGTGLITLTEFPAAGFTGITWGYHAMNRQAGGGDYVFGGSTGPGNQTMIMKRTIDQTSYIYLSMPGATQAWVSTNADSGLGAYVLTSAQVTGYNVISRGVNIGFQNVGAPIAGQWFQFEQWVLGRRGDGGAIQNIHGTVGCQIAYIGGDLSLPDGLSLSLAMETFNTALGRNV